MATASINIRYGGGPFHGRLRLRAYEATTQKVRLAGDDRMEERLGYLVALLVGQQAKSEPVLDGRRDTFPHGRRSPIAPHAASRRAQACPGFERGKLIVQGSDRHFADDVVFARLVAGIDDLSFSFESEDRGRGRRPVDLRRPDGRRRYARNALEVGGGSKIRTTRRDPQR